MDARLGLMGPTASCRAGIRRAYEPATGARARSRNRRTAAESGRILKRVVVQNPAAADPFRCRDGVPARI